MCMQKYIKAKCRVHCVDDVYTVPKLTTLQWAINKDAHPWKGPIAFPQQLLLASSSLYWGETLKFPVFHVNMPAIMP